MDNKTDLRIYAKELRKTLNLADFSKKAVYKLRNNKIYKSAKNVMIFYPMKFEINLLDLLNDKKNFYLPKVSKGNILVCPWSDNLVKSSFGVMEPQTEPVAFDILDLVIVPALMADKNCYRLGYGGGYYDRFLKQINSVTITVVPQILYVDRLPKEEFDIPVDKVITI